MPKIGSVRKSQFPFMISLSSFVATLIDRSEMVPTLEQKSQKNIIDQATCCCMTEDPQIHLPKTCCVNTQISYHHTPTIQEFLTGVFSTCTFVLVSTLWTSAKTYSIRTMQSTEQKHHHSVRTQQTTPWFVALMISVACSAMPNRMLARNEQKRNVLKTCFSYSYPLESNLSIKIGTPCLCNYYSSLCCYFYLYF